MCKRIVIIGAGGHGRVIADIAHKNGYEKIAFVDDYSTGTCMGLPIVGKSDGIESLNDGNTDFVIAIGNNTIRKKIAQQYNVKWAKLVHPSAQIGMCVEIGEGTVVMAGAVINPNAKIGKHCIINTCSVVEHDNKLCDYVHVSPNAALGGTVNVGEGTHIGIGATVKNNVDICENCVIGAGAVVVKNITDTATYVGVPAKKVL